MLLPDGDEAVAERLSAAVVGYTVMLRHDVTPCLMLLPYGGHAVFFSPLPPHF